MSYIEEFEKSMERFAAEVKKDKVSIMANKSAIRDLQSQREILNAEIETAKDKRLAYEKELESLSVKIEQRKAELKDLINS